MGRHGDGSAFSVGHKLSIDQYERDLKITCRLHVSGTQSRKKTRRRGKITAFSRGSVKRCKFALRNSIHLQRAIICLTYPKEYPEEGRVFKRHLDTFLKRLKRMNIQYFAVLEFQDRGAPHYHILLTRILNRFELSHTWYDIVASGDPRHLQAGTSIQFIVDDNDYRLEPDRVRYRELKRKGHTNVKRMFISRSEAESYMIGYFKKNDQKVIPVNICNSGRFWSHSRDLVEKLKSVVLWGDERDLKRKVRLLRRWYISKLRSWGIRYRGAFLPAVIWDGMGFVDNLYSHVSGGTLASSSP